MKKLTIISLCLFFIIGCSQTTERQPKYSNFNNAWEQDNLFGKVKYLEQFRANVVDIDSEKTERPIISIRKEYTDFGKIIDYNFFDNWGKPHYYTKNHFDKKENIIKSISENYLASSLSVEMAEFNINGGKISSNVVFDDTLLFITRFEYDSLGNVITLTHIQNNDTSSGNIEYSYNDKGKILQKKRIDNSEDGKYLFVDKFKYDENGNLIEFINKTEYSEEMRSTYNYNNKNRITTIILYKSGQIEKETHFDKYYNPITIKIYQKATLDREMKNEYKFDNYGNWIEKKVFLKEHFAKGKVFIPIYVETRKIEYYQ